METQTRFDLNAAIANWQQELAAQANLTPVVRKELETHLRDTITELQGRGLNNEESFWLARRRTGRPQQLGEEFAKTDLASTGRDRIFWVVVGLLSVNFWGTFVYSFQTTSRMPAMMRIKNILPDWVVFYLPNWLREFRTFFLEQAVFTLLQLLPVILLALFLAKRRLKFGHSALNYILASRARFVWVSFVAFLLANSFSVFQSGGAYFLMQLPWTLSLIALAAWLMRPNKNPAVTMS
jgi:hypothetical protein